MSKPSEEANKLAREIWQRRNSLTQEQIAKRIDAIIAKVNFSKQQTKGTKMKIATMIFALALIGTASAQTITNVGATDAGTPLTHNIGIAAVEKFDGDRNPTVYITINGKYWPLIPPSPYASAYCQVRKLDSATGKATNYGYIKAKSPDGTQFLGGFIMVQTSPKPKVISWKGIAFYTPTVMPTVTTNKVIAVYVYSGITKTFVPRPDLYRYSIFTSGAEWYVVDPTNGHYLLNSAVYEGPPGSGTSDGTPRGISIVPADHGEMNPTIMPAKVE